MYFGEAWKMKHFKSVKKGTADGVHGKGMVDSIPLR